MKNLWLYIWHPASPFYKVVMSTHCQQNLLDLPTFNESSLFKTKVTIVGFHTVYLRGKTMRFFLQ